MDLKKNYTDYFLQCPHCWGPYLEVQDYETQLKNLRNVEPSGTEPEFEMQEKTKEGPRDTVTISENDVIERRNGRMVRLSFAKGRRKIRAIADQKLA